MSDIEVIYEYLIDKSPKNVVNLEILTKKVSDSEMLKGLMVELWVKSEEYEIRKEDVTSVGASIGMSNIINKSSVQPLREVHKYFLDSLLTYTDRTIYLNDLSVSLLTHVLESESSGNTQGFEDKVSTLTQEELLITKDYFLKTEIYEYIKFFDKYIK